MSCSQGCCDSQNEHWRTIVIAPSATPTRSPAVAAASAKERRWEDDMDAYRRLRDDGLQPNRIDGAAEVEAKAETAVEVEAGQTLDPAQRRQLAKLQNGEAA